MQRTSGREYPVVAHLGSTDWFNTHGERGRLDLLCVSDRQTHELGIWAVVFRLEGGEEAFVGEIEVWLDHLATTFFTSMPYSTGQWSNNPKGDLDWHETIKVFTDACKLAMFYGTVADYPYSLRADDIIKENGLRLYFPEPREHGSIRSYFLLRVPDTWEADRVRTCRRLLLRELNLHPLGQSQAQLCTSTGVPEELAAPVLGLLGREALVRFHDAKFEITDLGIASLADEVERRNGPTIGFRPNEAQSHAE
jgi:hypothetical protein